MKTLIKNVNILTMTGDVLENSCLVVKDDLIDSIGQLEEDVDRVIDGRNGILLPGFINLHTHLAMAPFRSLGDDCKDRLRRFLFPLEVNCVDENLVYHATKYSIAELLLSGTTCMYDCYYFVDTLIKACEEMKIRGYACETIIDQKSISFDTASKAVLAQQEVFDKYKDNKLVKPSIFCHATNTCSLETLKASKELANKNNAIFSLHASEMTYEMDLFKEKYQMTPIEFLYQNDLLGPNTLLAHCILTNSHDIDLLAKTNTKVAHCIVSNLKAAKGVMPLKEMLDKGVTVGLGTDGPSSGNTLDNFTSLKMACCVHKTVNKDRSAFPCFDILKLSTIEAAKALGLDSQIGTIEVGKKADLMIVETESVNMYPIHDYYSAIVYSANSSNVDKVMVNGELLVDNKKLVNENLNTLRENLEKASTNFNNHYKEYQVD